MSDDHLSLDELAELDEDLLPPERTSAARSHLDGCAECRTRAESITATRTLLADLPAVTMPAEVQSRLEQAISEEAAGSRRGTTIVPNVVDLPRRRLGRPTMAASAAAAAVVLIIGAVVVGHVDHHSGGGETGGSASTAAGALTLVPAPTNQVGNPDFPTSISGRTYSFASLTPDITSLLKNATATANVAPGTPTAGSAAPPATSATPSTIPSATSSTKHPRRTPKPLGHSNVVESGAGGISSLDALPSALSGFAASRSKVLACAKTFAPDVGTFPVAVDFARWSAPAVGTTKAKDAVPALILVFPYSPDIYSVYIVAPPCDSASMIDFYKVAVTK